MLRYFYTIFLLLVNLALFAQGPGGRNLPALEGIPLDGLSFMQSGRGNTPGGKAPAPKNADGIDGTPYLFEEYQAGVLHFTTGKVAYAPLSYDIFNERVTVQLKDGNYNVSPEVINGFDIVAPAGDTMYFHRASLLPSGYSLGLSSESFVRVIYRGDIVLVGEHRKNYLEAPKTTNYGNGRENPEYNDQPTRYYLLRDDQPAERVKLRTGWLCRHFGLSGKEVKSILAQAGVEPGSEAAAAAIVGYAEQEP